MTPKLRTPIGKLRALTRVKLVKILKRKLKP